MSKASRDDSDFEASVDRCKKTYPEYANRIKRETPPLPMINKGVVSLTPVPDPLAKLIGPKKELEGQEGEAGIAAEGSEELEVIHTSNTECIKNNPEWFPGIEKKIIGIDGANCSPSQANKRISACIRFVKCKKVGQNGAADSFFLREALCAPNECGDDSPDQAAKCLASNHAIYHNLEDGTKKINAKTQEV